MTTLEDSLTYVIKSTSEDGRLLGVWSTDTLFVEARLHLSTQETTPTLQQQWYFTATDTPSYYRIHSRFRGSDKSLDVINDADQQSTRLHMIATGNWSGQYWRIEPWEGLTRNATTAMRMSNMFTGHQAVLGLTDDPTQPRLSPEGDRTLQGWLLQPLQRQPSADHGTLTQETNPRPMVNGGSVHVVPSRVTTQPSSERSATLTPSP
jgi:hypothetical protein